MDQVNTQPFANSPGFKYGVADITQVSVHGGSAAKKDIILAVGVNVTGTDKNGHTLTGPISRIRIFGAAKLYYIETEPGRDVRVHEVTPVEASQPSAREATPKSTFQKMEPAYGQIVEKHVLDFETFNMMSESKDIVITLPKTVKWEDYQKELKEAELGAVMNFKVPFFPKDCIGGKCYVVHNGKVKGWMPITGVSEKEFECETTGTKWAGKFIERTGKFNESTEEIEIKGFQGWRYAARLIK